MHSRCRERRGDVPVPRLVLGFAGDTEYDVPRRSYFDTVEE
jgi:hypothetical protein